jgi:ATP-dependent helicase/nuclease subunit A
VIDLTYDQKRAAEATGSAAVTAGAGTGKTRMLAERYLYHVQAQNLSPLAVVAVTFTDKAAAELRSRIRQTLVEKLSDEKAIAEVEAAQIGTMHALAARICRDFYYLAGIPADFAVLDETESPLWTAEKFEEAVGNIDIDITEGLGYRWLNGVLWTLLRDPIASEKALSLGAANWKKAIDEARVGAIDDLIHSDCWSVADETLRDCPGAAGDKLEAVRTDVLSAMAHHEPEAAIAELEAVLKKFTKRLGTTKSWDPCSLDRVRSCLIDLKTSVKNTAEVACLEFGTDDEEAARRNPGLKEAFHHVRDHIAAAKLREKVLDFSDLEYYALKILRQGEARGHYSHRWRAFLVDEFQDTNAVQAEILEQLSRGATLTIVGDEKQSIYGFRGAEADVFARVREQIVSDLGGIEVPLSETFRAHGELVASMNTVFEPVLGPLHQSLEARRHNTELPAPFIRSAVVECPKGTSPDDRQVIEARYITERIKELHGLHGVEYKDIAIIGRRWAPLETYLTVLSSSGIPAVNAGGGSLLETREARDMYSMLSFLADPHDGIALVALLRSPYFAYSDPALLGAAAGVDDEVTWWDVVCKAPEFAHAAQMLNQLLSAVTDHSAEQMLRLADRVTGYGAVVANLPQGSRRVADINGVYGILRKLEGRGRSEVFGVQRYFRELYETETDIPRPPMDAGDAVTLMTIHRAKGLEWPVVFIPDLASNHRGDSGSILVDRELGVAFQIDGDDYEKSEPAIHKLIKIRKKKRDIEEARRLLYVAVTRAKDKVFLTAGKPSGGDLDVLRPGLDAAGITDEVLPFSDEAAIAPNPGDPPPFIVPDRAEVRPVAIGLRELPVTALTVYAKCPHRFRLQYIDGHPGLAHGTGTGMRVGSLTHKALELGITDEAELRREAMPSDTEQMLSDAIALAETFRTHPAFAAFSGIDLDKEVRFAKPLNGLHLIGIADLVGDDFVLDYKTDPEMRPEEHRFQLWAYASGLDRPRAFIAYLRNGEIYELDAANLQAVAAEAEGLCASIVAGHYEATPSPQVCSVCQYSSMCKFACDAAEPQIGALQVSATR